MIIFLGDWLMIFKNRGFFLWLLSSLFFLPYCGLEIGEKAPPIPKHRESFHKGYCSKLLYKKEFSSYFLTPSEKQTGISSGERLKKALNCIGSNLESIKNLVNHETLDKQRLINFLNQDFLKNTQPIVSHIVDPNHFNNYLLIKDNLMHLIREQKADEVCKSQANTPAFSKQEASTLVKFFEELGDFFLMVETSSEDVFEKFFKKHGLAFKSEFENSNEFRDAFTSFLSEYLSKDFPEYSNLLTQHQGDEILQPLLSMAQLPLPSSDDLTVQNIKYIMLNVYIMKTIFSIYDVNRDSILDPKELEALSCFISPMISIILAPKLKEDASKFTKLIYSPKTILNYTLRYQDIPEGLNLSYMLFASCLPKDLKSLSYADISRLISVMFNYFFKRKVFNSKPKGITSENIWSIVNRIIEPDYESSFNNGFFNQDMTINDMFQFVGDKSSRILNCAVSILEDIKEDLIPYNSFGREDIVTLLNQDFLKKKEIEPLIDFIANPNHIDDYLLILRNTIQLIAELKVKPANKSHGACESQIDRVTFSEEDLSAFIDFLEDLAEVSLKIQQTSEDIFEGFFEPNDWLLKSELEESHDFRSNFSPFLSRYLSEDFPEYSEFLLRRGKYKALQPLIDTIQLTPPNNDLTAQDIKYMVLNIYIMQAFFSIYNANQDSKLEPKELKPLSCFITPLMSIIISHKIKSSPKFFRRPLIQLFDASTVANYILKYQEVPSVWNVWDITTYKYGAWYTDLKDLSYTDVSSLISAVFSVFPNRESPPQDQKEVQPSPQDLKEIQDTDIPLAF